MMNIDPIGFSKSALIALSLSVLGACSHQPTEYAWSHHESGEYLFAFDAQGCDTIERGTPVDNPAAQATVKSSPAFFACMQNLGYFLVDPLTGERLSAAINQPVSTISDSQAAR